MLQGPWPNTATGKEGDVFCTELMGGEANGCFKAHKG